MITAGVDSGSVATKVVLVADDRVIVGRSLTATGSAPGEAGLRAFEEALAAAHAGRADVVRVLATGYGRRRIAFAHGVVTEIAACARGATWGLETDARTLVDMGGQDVKAIQLNACGQVEDFIMNDKCAAGTGRFLEVIAGALEVPLGDMASLAKSSQNPCSISNTCTVFAESEVVSLVAAGEEVADILSGVHASIADRIAGMLGGLPVGAAVVFCGGGARNAAIADALGRQLGAKVIVPPEPQFRNATGAALLAGG